MYNYINFEWEYFTSKILRASPREIHETFISKEKCPKHSRACVYSERDLISSPISRTSLEAGPH